jgi:GAF domain-containing protein/HAMP domain-containing protein
MLDAIEQPTLNDKQARVAFLSAIVMASALFAISIYAVISTLPVENLRRLDILAADFLPMVGSGIALMSGWICWRKQQRVGIYILAGILLATIFGLTMITAGLGVWLGLTAIIVTATIASQCLPQKEFYRLSGIGLVVAIATILIDLYNPLPRFSEGQSLRTFMGIVLGLIMAIYLAYMATQFPNYSLRVKLITAFIILSLIAVLILGLFYNIATRNALTQSTNNALHIAAQQTANNIDGFYQNLIAALKTEADLPVFRNFLALDVPNGSVEEYSTFELLNNLQQTSSALGYSVLSITGTVMVDTANQNSQTLGFNVIPTYTYTSVLTTSGTYLSPILFPQDGQEPYLFIMERINDKNGKFAGILMVRFSAEILQTTVAASNNLTGPDSYAILWDENKIRLANGINPGVNFTTINALDEEGIVRLQTSSRLPPLVSPSLLILENANLSTGLDRVETGKMFFTAQDAVKSGSQEDGENIIVAAVKIISQPWIVTYVQSQSTALAAVTQQTRATVGMAIAIVLSVSILGVFVTQQFTRPITQLTKTAEKITGGDLDARADVNSQDEIGTLATTFNLMTAELRQSLATLENRVTERTAKLVQVSEQMEKRATQLQSVAELAHAIASIKDPEQLLQQITLFISERFGFYHVGVFLLDKAGEYAVLQSANSEGGFNMLKRGHRLEVGGSSMVGYVAQQGKPRIALDVGKDAVFFDNPDLPLTRSEMAIPLLSGNTRIGVLDIQSEQASAFTDEDVALLSTLADQVSIAIENARLFSEINQTLYELQSLQRQYLQQEWQRTVAEQMQSGYQYTFGKVSPLMRAQTQELAEDKENSSTGLNIPIILRGQEIGSFKLDDIDRDRKWSEEEIALVKTIADQVGLALENARLLEVTQRRAARDRMVAEITNKMRRAVDMDTLIQTAVREITNAIDSPEAFVQLGVSPEAEQHTETSHER